MRRSKALVTSTARGHYRAGEDHLWMMNRRTGPADVVPGAIWCHGAAAEEWAAFFSVWGPELAYAGAHVLATDMGGYHTWGNDTAMAGLTNTSTFLDAQTGSSPPWLLSGGSMGSINALVWALQNPTLVSAVAVALPIIDVEWVRANTAFGVNIEAAYGGLAGWNAARPTRNPIEFADSWPIDIPVRLYVSDNDTVGRPVDAQAFVDAVNLAGGEAEYISYGAQGHTFNNLPIDAAEWMLSKV